MSSCRTYRRHLLALIDGQLEADAAARVSRHLESCESCAAAVQRLQQARSAMQRLREAEPPEVNYRQVEAQVRWRLAHSPSAPTVQLRRPFALLALASTLAIGGVCGALIVSHYRTAPTPRPATRPSIARTAPVEAKPIELAALPNLVAGKVLVATEDGVIGPLELTRPILPGERLITEQGEAALQWDKGSGLRLRSASEVQLAILTDQEQKLVLLRGRLDVQAAHRPPGRRLFAVVGGGIQATVKGTAFSVSLGDGMARVLVNEGVVVVGPTGGRSWSEVVLATGQRKRLVDGVVALRAGEQLEAVVGGVPRIAAAASDRQSPSLNLQVPWNGLHRLIATSGALLVESKPNGAEVHIDSIVLGRTNLTARGAIGRHLVEVWRGDRLLRRQWVQVGAAASTRIEIAKPAPSRLPTGLYQVFRRRAPLIRACYERQLKRTPKLSGRFVLRIAIDEAGKVSDAKLDLDTLPEPQVGRCALAVVKRWIFPPGQSAEVVYPFVFRPD